MFEDAAMAAAVEAARRKEEEKAQKGEVARCHEGGGVMGVEQVTRNRTRYSNVAPFWSFIGVPAGAHARRSSRINGGLRAPTREHPRYMSNYEVAIRTAGSP